MELVHKLILRWIAIAIISIVGLLGVGMVHAETPATCGPEGQYSFICGIHNAEDLSDIPGSPWIIASSNAGPNVKGNLLYFINRLTEQVVSFDPGTIGSAPDPQYSDCKSPLEPLTFSGHGIFVGGALRRLYAINHGGREAVEIFDILVDKPDAPPRPRWVGCIAAPPHAFLNGVVALNDGGIAATRFYDDRDPPARWMTDMLAGQATGEVVEWHPGRGWAIVADSSVSGGNGLAITPDEKTFFIAAWGSRRLVRLTRGDETHRDSIDVGINIDNLRWDRKGKLLAAGQMIAGRQTEVLKCFTGPNMFCPIPYRALRIDPDTLKVETIVPEDDSKTFAFGAGIVDAVDSWWVGPVRGDRIARVAKK